MDFPRISYNQWTAGFHELKCSKKKETFCAIFKGRQQHFNHVANTKFCIYALRIDIGWIQFIRVG